MIPEERTVLKNVIDEIVQSKVCSGEDITVNAIVAEALDKFVPLEAPNDDDDVTDTACLIIAEEGYI